MQTVTSSGPQKRDAKGETVSTEAIQKLAKALEATGTVSLVWVNSYEHLNKYSQS